MGLVERGVRKAHHRSEIRKKCEIRGAATGRLDVGSGGELNHESHESYKLPKGDEDAMLNAAAVVEEAREIAGEGPF